MIHIAELRRISASSLSKLELKLLAVPSTEDEPPEEADDKPAADGLSRVINECKKRLAVKIGSFVTPPQPQAPPTPPQHHQNNALLISPSLTPSPPVRSTHPWRSDQTAPVRHAGALWQRHVSLPLPVGSCSEAKGGGVAEGAAAGHASEGAVQ